MLLLSKNTMNKNIKSIFRFGSRVYGSATKDSDTDIIVVVDDNANLTEIEESYKNREGLDVEVLRYTDFQNLLYDMDVRALECYFSEPQNNFNTQLYTFVYDEIKLRKQFSKTSSNSWVKGKKKLTIEKDYDVRCGIKSIFHSFRILDFAIQIASYQQIQDWTRYNYILEDLYTKSEAMTGDELWDYITEKYKPLYNNLKSVFKKSVKLSLNETDNLRGEIISILTKFNTPFEVIDEINLVFSK
jgi:predicted nucleotidyltransferase